MVVWGLGRQAHEWAASDSCCVVLCCVVLQAAAAANKGAATAAALEAADAAVEQGKPFLVLQLQVGVWSPEQRARWFIIKCLLEGF